MGSEIAYRKPTARKSTIEAKRSRKAALKTVSDTSGARKALELFLFAHLNLAADAEAELAELGFHRTHHRILYLVAGNPGLRVGDLISTLRLTAQAVQSPMKQLNEKGFIEQRYASTDRRKRCLFITAKGESLIARLSARQHNRLAQAFDQAGPAAVRGFMAVMERMLTDKDRQLVERSSV
jgi:DNA-binding MarR family transcriptional regulator